MTGLTKARNLTRTTAIMCGVLLVLIILGRIGFGLIHFILVTLPTQQAAAQPTVDFGKLPEPVLQPVSINTNAASVQLDLVDGQLPQSSPSAKVYKVAQPALSLSAQDRARARAAQLGFANIPPTQPNPTTLSWNNDTQHLAIDLSSQTFTMTADQAKLDMPNRQNFSRFTPLATNASNFLQNLMNFPDIQYQSPVIEYVSPVGTIYTPQPEDATDLTNYARITFLRQDLDDLPMYAATGKFGPITMVLVPPHKVDPNAFDTPNIDLDQIALLTSTYFPIDTKSPGRYPIISAQTAFSKLQRDLKKYLVSVEPATSTTPPTSFIGGRVLFVRLAYLEPDPKNDQYVQPVWMFEGRATTDAGEARWIAYVPAVDQPKTDQFLQKK